MKQTCILPNSALPAQSGLASAAFAAIIVLFTIGLPLRLDAAVVTYEITGLPSANIVNPLPSRLIFSYDTAQIGSTCINSDGAFGPGVPITGSAWYGGVLLAEFDSINLVVYTGAIRTSTDCGIPPSIAYPDMSLNGLNSFRPDGRLLGDGEVYTSPPSPVDAWGLNGIWPQVPEVPTGNFGWQNLTMREIPEPSIAALAACNAFLLLRRRR